MKISWQGKRRLSLFLLTFFLIFNFSLLGQEKTLQKPQDEISGQTNSTSEKKINTEMAHYFALGIELSVPFNTGLHLQYRPFDLFSLETHILLGYFPLKDINGYGFYLPNVQLFSSLNFHFPNALNLSSGLSIGPAYSFSSFLGHGIGLNIALSGLNPDLPLEKARSVQEYANSLNPVLSALPQTKGGVVTGFLSSMNLFVLYNLDPVASATRYLRDYYNEPTIQLTNSADFLKTYNLSIVFVVSYNIAFYAK